MEFPVIDSIPLIRSLSVVRSTSYWYNKGVAEEPVRYHCRTILAPRNYDPISPFDLATASISNRLSEMSERKTAFLRLYISPLGTFNSADFFWWVPTSHSNSCSISVAPPSISTIETGPSLQYLGFPLLEFRLSSQKCSPMPWPIARLLLSVVRRR